MRSDDDVRSVLTLSSEGLNAYEISRRMGIPRSTVDRWIRMEGVRKTPTGAHLCFRCTEVAPDPAAYAYVLGIYLGDGTIVRQPNGTWRLELTQDAAYERLVEQWVEAVGVVLPRRVSRRTARGSVVVSSYSNHWPCLFPQAGPGKKHARAIALAVWQQEIVDAHPQEFIRGLIESDGCRHINRVTNRQGTRYEYVRYSFSNRSDDIRALFVEACHRIDVYPRPTTRYVVAISRRAEVALLDAFIGPKS